MWNWSIRFFFFIYFFLCFTNQFIVRLQDLHVIPNMIFILFIYLFWFICLIFSSQRSSGSVWCEDFCSLGIYNEAKQCNQKYWSNFCLEIRLWMWNVQDENMLIELKTVSANDLFCVNLLANLHFHSTIQLNEQWTTSMKRTKLLCFRNYWIRKLLLSSDGTMNLLINIFVSEVGAMWRLRFFFQISIFIAMFWFSFNDFNFELAPLTKFDLFEEAAFKTNDSNILFSFFFYFH